MTIQLALSEAQRQKFSMRFDASFDFERCTDPEAIRRAAIPVFEAGDHALCAKMRARFEELVHQKKTRRWAVDCCQVLHDGPRSLCLNLVGSIPPDGLFNATEAVKAARGRDVRLTITSSGGDVDEARTFVNALNEHRASGGRIYAHAREQCSSAAIWVLMTADSRTASPGTKFLLHDPAGGEGATPADAIRAEDAVAHEYASFLGQRGGVPADYIRRQMDIDREFTPGDLLASQLGIREYCPVKGTQQARQMLIDMERAEHQLALEDRRREKQRRQDEEEQLHRDHGWVRTLQADGSIAMQFVPYPKERPNVRRRRGLAAV